MGARLTHDIVKNRVESMYDGEYELLSKYSLQNKPITLKHKVCGHVYEVKRAKSFYNEGKCTCPKCYPPVRKPKPKNFDALISQIYNLVGDEYTVLTKLDKDIEIRMHKKIEMIHNKCGYVWMVTPTDFITTSVRCPECAKKARREGSVRKNYLNNLLKSCYDGCEYNWMESYKGDNKLKHKILHKKCNREYMVRPNDFQQGYRCPYCAPKGSQMQRKVYEELIKIYNGKILLEYSHPKIPKKRALISIFQNIKLDLSLMELIGIAIKF